ncbi:outer membrane protein transport protein [uncultured Roseobacter sp.]|uniref:outer membrane protein transport protein n=1 Tax=uncultured Roseobacter sp. TaxID=114847 RepID=UPI00261ECA6A|nr:outer membrane protein transport protein [uncultured Roseobacter sp.]
MRNYLKSVTAMCLAAGGAHAGALDRTGQSVDVLFEDGRYVEFSFATISPTLSGTGTTLTPGVGSGDISPAYQQYGAAYKADINDRLSYAIILDQPFDASVDYPTGTGYFAAGSSAEYDSMALTGLLQYNVGNGASVYGGLRLQSAEANATIQFNTPVPALNLDYAVDASRDYGVGYVFGVAYEKPEIALRVSLTYNSEISHANDTFETSVALGTRSSVTEFETPQSLNLAFQTGIAPNTLLFGGIRWVDWSDFALTPSLYFQRTGGASLLSYAEDVTTYTLGVGRKLNDTWSVAASLGYEQTQGNLFTNLGPSDGQRSVGLAAIYTQGKMKITTGIRYVRIGDTTTVAGPFSPAGTFENNDAVAIGVKIGYTF